MLLMCSSSGWKKRLNELEDRSIEIPQIKMQKVPLQWVKDLQAPPSFVSSEVVL